MWEWRWRWGNDKEKTHHHHHHLFILRNDDEDLDCDHHPKATISSVAMVLTSWLRRRHKRYLLLLALFSPLLLPFLCATFPLLCAVEVCIRFCRLRRRNRKPIAAAVDRGGDGLRRCEEGNREIEGGEMRLLQRYLEDQLVLVIGSVYDCGGDDCCDDLLEYYDGVEFFDTSNPI